MFDIVQHITGHYSSFWTSQHIHQTPSDERKQLSNSFIYLPEVFLKSPEKNETIFPTEVMFLSCLVWIGMTSQKPNRWLTR